MNKLEETLSPIKERLAKATEAAKPPYITFPYYHLSICTEEFPKVGLCNMVDTQPFFTPEMQAAVAEMFAHAPTDIKTLIDLIDKQGKVAEWQPIETAPKDGTRILGGCPGAVKEIYWYEGHKIRGKDVFYVGCEPGWVIYVVGIDYDDPVRFEPTDWMPLPEAPKPALETLNQPVKDEEGE
jgi:hypothetical protein